MEEESDFPVFRVLYLFCGQPRKADLRAWLVRLAPKYECTVHVREVDIARSSEDDLAGEDLWNRFFTEVADDKWDCVFLSPPCNTFSRARHLWRRHPGPRPLRSKEYPYGFPWASSINKQTLGQHNFFIIQCKRMAKTAVKAGKFYLWEHPEDLGKIQDTEDTPGSIWQWEELHSLLRETNSVTWAIYQCHFGADTPKPTRLLGNVRKQFPCSGWPCFDANGFYAGPLKKGCGHKFHIRKLIGKTNGVWNTSPSAAYPSRMCKYLAEILLSRFVGGPPGLDSCQVEVDKAPSSEHSKTELITESTTETLADGKEGDSSGEEHPGHHQHYGFNKLCSGQPISSDWDLRRLQLVDGLGLCSPNRWWPSDRFVFQAGDSASLAGSLHDLVRTFVLDQIPDLRKASFELAVGKLVSSPFSAEAIWKVRKSWAQLLPRPGKALEIAERQPFLLEMLSQTLQILGDPDWRILTEETDSFATGVPVGYDKPLPRVTAVFPPKEKHRRLDESTFMEDSANYKSADEMAEKLEDKFREEEQLGRMFPSTLGALKSMFPGEGVLIAPMGALPKPDGGVRPLHDATHHVQVNNAIKYQDQLEYPGPGDAAALVESSRLAKEACFAVSADIQAAHRLVKIRKQDWRLLCCRSHSDSPVVWVNCVGTFGVSSASYWWSRLFSLVGRLVTSVLKREPNLQIVYVDDLHILVWGQHKFLWLWMMIATYEIVGTPFGYHKFKGGLEIPFVGYELDYYRKTIGLSQKRADWLQAFMMELERNKYTVPMRDFNEFLGRLGFVARILVWIKPHLAPLYSWSAALDRGCVATAPKMVRLVIRYLKSQLEALTRRLSSSAPLRAASEEFRTDAKCERGRVVLAGHHLCTKQWFIIEVSPGQAPYLFDKDQESSWASASAELLASLAALQLFGYLEDTGHRRVVPVAVTAGTDNQANEALSKKRSSTAWPLMLINMQLSHHLFRASLQLTLKWRPRDENQEADDLTNGRLENFDRLHQVNASFEMLDLGLLKELWEERSDFLDRDALKTWPVVEAPNVQFQIQSAW